MAPLKKFSIFITLILITLCVNSQIITTVAGNGQVGYSGDGGPAIAAAIRTEGGIFVDPKGNIFFGDNSSRVRRVDGMTGIITTIAGTGVAGFSGDGGPATSAEVYAPIAVYEDKIGNVYFYDAINFRIRKIDTSGIISTIAGIGTHGYAGDGGPATSATLDVVYTITSDTLGNIYFADAEANVIRKINTAGIISTIAGNGANGYSGDGGPATSAAIQSPYSLSFDTSGNYYVAGNPPNYVRKIDKNNIITTIAGSGSTDTVSTGDGGPATSATFRSVKYAIVDSSNNIYITDGNRIREINGKTGIINTIAGSDSAGYSGDAGLATAALLNNPVELGLANGNLYIIDKGNSRIRKISNLTTLPIKLLTFTGYEKDQNIYLTWSTTNEINSKYFDLERSTDGTSYAAIDKISSKGNSSTNSTYSSIDRSGMNSNTNKLYYRLKIVDVDGGYSYSNIIFVNLNTLQHFSITPNPAKEFIIVKGDNIQQVQIFDATGKVYLTKTVVSQNQKIELTGLSKGVYFVKGVNKNGQSQVNKLVIE